MSGLPSAEREVPGCPATHSETLTPCPPLPSPRGVEDPMEPPPSPPRAPEPGTALSTHGSPPWSAHGSRAGHAAAPGGGGKPTRLSSGRSGGQDWTSQGSYCRSQCPLLVSQRGRCGGPAVAPTLQMKKQTHGFGFWTQRGQRERQGPDGPARSYGGRRPRPPAPWEPEPQLCRDLTNPARRPGGQCPSPTPDGAEDTDFWSL